MLSAVGGIAEEYSLALATGAAADFHAGQPPAGISAAHPAVISALPFAAIMGLIIALVGFAIGAFLELLYRIQTGP